MWGEEKTREYLEKAGFRLITTHRSHARHHEQLVHRDEDVFHSSEFPLVADIESRWQAIARDQADFIAGLTDERLATDVSYENLAGERWEYSLAEMMQHLANHSSYHRGQVATLLRQLNYTPPATDFLLYRDEIREALPTLTE